jgi:hypothetical protein
MNLDDLAGALKKGANELNKELRTELKQAGKVVEGSAGGGPRRDSRLFSTTVASSRHIRFISHLILW